MKWIKLSVSTTSESVEAVSEILTELGAKGVEIQDAADFKHIDPEAIGPYGEVEDVASIPHLQQGAVVAAYFADDQSIKTITQQLNQRIQALPKFGLSIGAGTIKTTSIKDEDWAEAWKKYYHPTQITRFLTVVPDWETYHPTTPDEYTVILDPGMSFGTGTHPTTTLALLALEKVLRSGQTVFDIGTGSGILSIAASKMGAGLVKAYDLDQVAVAAAKANVALNSDVNNISVMPSNLFQSVTGRADLILANILAEIIDLMIPDIDTFLRSKGRIIFSGIIKDKLPAIEQRLAAYHLAIETKLQEKEWVALIVGREDEL
ncbi:50S ribosomal protein L11 methyltransferase [Agrilactobacillus fermenti]|uniref:50S ribosomal protein L11 methyltransferase n=1 Tax=Agrilactobacillus fermenti TaxID=2586909 RepID=UPI001E43A065|nr:50S ribosomal protein L11 methyltransferase [Agrilactobacillus fermenti]MCD2255795.1 50S ribosomal protein L11 methyltransferase [Agrilactobacillus fermenti]